MTTDSTQADTFEDHVQVKFENGPLGSVSSAVLLSEDSIAEFGSFEFFKVPVDNAFMRVDFFYPDLPPEANITLDREASQIAAFCLEVDGIFSFVAPADLALSCADASDSTVHFCQTTLLDQGSNGSLFFPVNVEDSEYVFDLMLDSQNEDASGRQRVVITVAPSALGTSLCTVEEAEVILEVVLSFGLGILSPEVLVQLCEFAFSLVYGIDLEKVTCEFDPLSDRRTADVKATVTALVDENDLDGALALLDADNVTDVIDKAWEDGAETLANELGLNASDFPIPVTQGVVDITPVDPSETTITPMAVSLQSAKLRSCDDVGSASAVGGCWEVRIEATFTQGFFESRDADQTTSVTATAPGVSIPGPALDSDVYTWILPEELLIGGASSEYSREVSFSFSETFTIVATDEVADSTVKELKVLFTSTPFGSVSSVSSASDDDILAFATARYYTVDDEAFVALNFLYTVAPSVDVAIDLARSSLDDFCDPMPSTPAIENCSDALFAFQYFCTSAGLDNGRQGSLYYPVDPNAAPFEFDLTFTAGAGLQRLILTVAPSVDGGVGLCDGQSRTVDILQDLTVTFYAGIGANPPSFPLSLSGNTNFAAPLNTLQGGSVRSESLITMSITSASQESFAVQLIDLFVVYDWDSATDDGVTADEAAVSGISGFVFTIPDLPATDSCTTGDIAVEGDCSYYHSGGPNLDPEHVRELGGNETNDKLWIKNYLQSGSSEGIDTVVDAFYATVYPAESLGAWFVQPFAAGYATEVFVTGLFEVVPTGDIAGTRRLLAASGVVDGVAGSVVRFDVTPGSFTAAMLGLSDEYVLSWTISISLSAANACLESKQLMAYARNTILAALSSVSSGVNDAQISSVEVNLGGVVCDAAVTRRSLLEVGPSASVHSLIIMNPAADERWIDQAALLAQPSILSAAYTGSDSGFVQSSELEPAVPGANGDVDASSAEEEGTDSVVPGVVAGSAAGVVIIAVGAAVWARRKVAATEREAEEAIARVEATVYGTMEARMLPVGGSAAGKREQAQRIEELFGGVRESLATEPQGYIQATVHGTMKAMVVEAPEEEKKAHADRIEELLGGVRDTVGGDRRESQTALGNTSARPERTFFPRTVSKPVLAGPAPELLVTDRLGSQLLLVEDEEEQQAVEHEATPVVPRVRSRMPSIRPPEHEL